MDTISVNPMTALVEGNDMPPERGDVSGWGWTHWDGPDYGKLYRVYACQDRNPSRFWIEVWVDGERTHELPKETDFQQWALERGWRPVVSYMSHGSFVGYDGSRTRHQQR